MCYAWLTCIIKHSHPPVASDVLEKGCQWASPPTVLPTSPHQHPSGGTGRASVQLEGQTQMAVRHTNPVVRQPNYNCHQATTTEYPKQNLFYFFPLLAWQSIFCEKLVICRASRQFFWSKTQYFFKKWVLVKNI